MQTQPRPALLPLLGVLALAACATGVTAQSALPGVGPQPQLPAPEKSLLPTVDIAPAEGWPEGATPQVPAGFRVTALAKGLQHPRWVYT
ncbi:MAG: sorbosone dehydrogenase family protein, partial [Ramlibacter sp.]|nr:sorbosone dehydrogenase family protein [Ramlibacter sp.]